MRLLYKQDFDDCRSFWRSFWEHPRKTRPALLYPSARDGMEPAPLPNPLTLITDDIDAFGDRLERYFETHALSADMMPGIPLCFGADHFAALLGAKMTVDRQHSTTWIEPCVDDWDAASLRVDWNNGISRRTLECIEKLRRRFDGKLLISPPHLQGNLDCLAALRGVQPLLCDLLDCPDKIHRALDQVNRAFAEVVGIFRREFDTDTWGSVNRHGLYQPGFAGLLQCDFSCMINPEMFAKFAVPALTFEAATVDYAEYHLDGPGALQHLEAIAAIKKIQVIQWQPGAALLHEDWRELHRRIDACGCGQYFFRPDVELCRWIMANLKNHNCCLDLSSRSAADFKVIHDLAG